MFDFVPPPPPSWAEFLSVWSPIFIAACALGFSFWAAWAQRHHNRLSVRPQLNIASDKDSLRIENSGLGPAQIGAVEGIVGDEVFSFNSPTSANRCVSRLFPSPDTKEQVGWINENVHILPGRNFKLITPDGRVDQNYYVAALMDLKLKVEYQSMYGERMEPVEWRMEEQRSEYLQQQEER